MLTHMRLAGLFDGVRGLVFGDIAVVEADRHLPYGVPEVILDVLGDLAIPILYGFPSGHCQQPLTLPFGVQAAIRQGRLMLYESPVERLTSPGGASFDIETFFQQEIQRQTIPGAVVCVAHRGQIVWHRAMVWRRWCRSSALCAAAPVRHCLLTKVVATTSLLLAHHDGVCALDDRLPRASTRAH